MIDNRARPAQTASFRSEVAFRINICPSFLPRFLYQASIACTLLTSFVGPEAIRLFTPTPQLVRTALASLRPPLLPPFSSPGYQSFRRSSLARHTLVCARKSSHSLAEPCAVVSVCSGRRTLPFSLVSLLLTYYCTCLTRLLQARWARERGRRSPIRFKCARNVHCAASNLIPTKKCSRPKTVSVRAQIMVWYDK